jgi:hypothetical protein
MYLRELSWLRKGSPVPQKTATAQLSGNRERVGDAESETDEVDNLKLAWKRSIQDRSSARGVKR